MSLARFSVRNPVLVNMLFVLLLVAGGYSYLTMTQEVFPQFPLKLVSISTLYPEVRPADVERLVTIPLEQAISGVDGIHHVQSVSVEGRSQIVLELEQSVQDVQRKVDRIEREIALVRRDLPEQAEDPLVREIEFEIPVLVYALSSARKGLAGELELREWARAFEDELKAVRGVSSLVVRGVRKRQVHVLADPRKMEAHQIGFAELVAAIKGKNVTVAAGTVQTATGEMTLRVAGEVARGEELRDVILRSLPNGDKLTLGDVARVIDGFEDPRRLARVGGKPAVSVVVNKGAGTNAITLKRELDRRSAAFTRRLPEHIRLTSYLDTTQYIVRRVQTMENSFWLGLCFVMFVLCLFLNWRLALMTGLGIPIAIGFAFLVYSRFGGTSNMLSLFAVLLVLGMVVDDGIIISENIYRYIEKGVHPIKAAVLGTQEVFWAVLLAIATTIAAFLPLLLTEGRVGQFLGVIPVVASLCLVGSLAEAFIVLPSHVADFVPPAAKKERRLVLDFVIGVFAVLLRRAVRCRYLVVALVIAISIGTLCFAFLYMDVVFFRADYLDYFLVRIEADPAGSLEDTERIVARAERRLERFPRNGVSSITSHVGVMLTDDGLIKEKKNLAYIMVDIDERYALHHDRDEIIGLARRLMSGLRGPRKLSIGAPQGGPPQKSDIELHLAGNDLGRLERASRTLQRRLLAVPGVQELTSDYEAGKPELEIQIAEPLAALGGLDVHQVARSLRAAFGGETASRMRWGRDEVEVVVRLPEPASFEEAHLRELVLARAGGDGVRLGSIAALRRSEGAAALVRRDRKPTINLTGSIDKSRTTVRAITPKLEAELERFREEHPGLEVTLGGGNEDIQLMFRSMAKAALLSLVLIYAILATLFRSFGQPLVVMFIVPFAFVGVVTGLLLAGEPLSFMSLLGAVALSGIVVNDSVVLVDFANQRRMRGVGPLRAVIAAAKLRFRPIVLTSITTIFGLLPLAVGVSGQEQFLAPMALSIIWGLVFSTVLTLLGVPCVYLIADDLTRLFGMRGFDKQLEVARVLAGS